MNAARDLGPQVAAVIASARDVGEVIDAYVRASTTGDPVDQAVADGLAEILGDITGDVAGTLEKLDAWRLFQAAEISRLEAIVGEFAAQLRHQRANMGLADGLELRLLVSLAKARGVDIDRAPDKGLLAATRVRGPRVNVGLRRGGGELVVGDPVALPERFVEWVPQPDRVALRKAVKASGTIEEETPEGAIVHRSIEFPSVVLTQGTLRVERGRP